MKLQNADYKGQDPDAALADFLRRVEEYEARYETVRDDEGDGSCAYVKLINVGEKVITRHCSGYLTSQLAFFLGNVHIAPRRIWLALHGESRAQVESQRIGASVGGLTRRGAAFSRRLAAFVSEAHSAFRADFDLDENAAQMTPKEALRLTGFETFALDYNAPWPVSLVLSRRAITKYQLLFRHVFHCKHVERRLCEAWQTHQATRAAAAQTTGAGDGGSLGRAYVLSQRMLHFLQNFTYYLMCEVVEPNWHAFETALRDAQSVDELIDAHERFLDACMKEGMLFWPRILRRLERIKNVCLKFCGLSETLEQSLPGRGSFRENLRAGRLSVAGGEDTGSHRVSASARERVEARHEAAQAIFDACEGDKYASEVARLEEDFDAQLRELLEALNGSAHLEPNLASLCARLDFNEFYSFGPGGKYT